MTSQIWTLSISTRYIRIHSPHLAEMKSFGNIISLRCWVMHELEHGQRIVHCKNSVYNNNSVTTKIAADFYKGEQWLQQDCLLFNSSFASFLEPWANYLASFFVNEGFPGGSEGKVSACNAGDPGSISGSGKSSGEGNGNPPQYSCLENMYGEA